MGRVAALFDRIPDRFLFGTDNVAPPNIDANVGCSGCGRRYSPR